MILLRIFGFSATLVLVSFIFLSPLSYAAEDSLNEGITENVVLTPADQLILDRIDRVNDRIDKLGKELNGRIDNLGKELNGRIDTLRGHKGVKSPIKGVKSPIDLCKSYCLFYQSVFEISGLFPACFLCALPHC